MSKTRAVGLAEKRRQHKKPGGERGGRESGVTLSEEEIDKRVLCGGVNQLQQKPKDNKTREM